MIKTPLKVAILMLISGVFNLSLGKVIQCMAFNDITGLLMGTFVACLSCVFLFNFDLDSQSWKAPWQQEHGWGRISKPFSRVIYVIKVSHSIWSRWGMGGPRGKPRDDGHSGRSRTGRRGDAEGAFGSEDPSEPGGCSR